MLRDDIAQYTELSGNDGLHTPIGIIGAYLDGYEKGKSDAQPETLTDKEQRIFLSAMGREEKVCELVDAECRDCREPYEDSLVRTCREIIRKVKGALWTTI